MANDLMFYQFSQSKVERVDFSRFLGLHAPDKLLEGRRLRDMTNCFVPCIEGWDSDACEIRMIPEIRRFYLALRDAWPYWLDFCKLDAGTLGAMTLCSTALITTKRHLLQWFGTVWLSEKPAGSDGLPPSGQVSTRGPGFRRRRRLPEAHAGS